MVRITKSMLKNPVKFVGQYTYKGKFNGKQKIAHRLIIFPNGTKATQKLVLKKNRNKIYIAGVRGFLGG